MKKYLIFFLISFAALTACVSTEQKTENLIAFAKAYGYIKYFHPSDEASQIDWLKFAIYGAQEIEKCRTKADVVETMNRLFQPIAPSVIFSLSEKLTEYDIKKITPENTNGYHLTYWQHLGVQFGMNDFNGHQNLYSSLRVNRTKEGQDKQLFAYHPLFGNIISKEISKGIYCQIPQVLYCNKLNTFPKANIDLLNQLNEELKNCDVKAENLSFRLGNIITTFNVFQHFYPYFDVVKVDWKVEFKKALTRCYSDKTARNHLLTLKKFTAPLKDGHIWVECRYFRDYSNPPITWEWIENQLVITGVYKDSLDIKIGDIVSKINGQNARDYFNAINAGISAGTKGWLNYRANTESLQGEFGTKLIVTINNKPIELTRYSSYSNPEAWSKKSDSIINDSIYYINLDLISTDAIKSLIPKLVKSKAIICDLRGYPRSNPEFIRHFLKTEDTVSAWMQVPRIVYPDQERILGYAKYNWKGMMKPMKPFLGDKKIVFIIDGSAISYAESYMGYIEGYHLATIVGQPTAGTNGNVNTFDLAGGYSIRFTGMKVLKHNGSQHHGIGILPNIFVNNTFEQYVKW
jgi:hypothetical protein